MNLNHRHAIVPWITQDGKKILLTFEFEFSVPDEHWAPSESACFMAAYSTTPDGSGVFDCYGIDDAQFEALIEHQVDGFEKIVKQFMSALNDKFFERTESTITNIGITSTVCKFYNPDLHEHEDY